MKWILISSVFFVMIFLSVLLIAGFDVTGSEEPPSTAQVLPAPAQ